MINRHVAPGKNFVFPVRVQADGKQRRFQRCWLEEFPWLVYSVKCDAGFCLPCLLFADDDPKLGQLYRSPLNTFTRFKTACHHHVDQNVHKNAMMKYTNFKQTVQQGTAVEFDIVQQLVDVSGAQAAHNMEKLRGIVESTVFVLYILRHISYSSEIILYLACISATSACDLSMVYVFMSSSA